MIKGVIFDMDGLLIDTERLSLSCWRRALGEAGLPFIPEIITDCRGTGHEESKKAFDKHLKGYDADFDALALRAKELMTEAILEEGLHPKVGVFTVLRRLRELGYKLALATSTSEQTATRYMKTLDIFDAFDVRVYGNMFKRYKPAPDIFIKACKLLDFAPADCLVLEDSPNGLKAAHAAGAKPMMIPDLTDPTADLLPILYAQGATLLDVLLVLEDDRAGKESLL